MLLVYPGLFWCGAARSVPRSPHPGLGHERGSLLFASVVVFTPGRGRRGVARLLPILLVLLFGALLAGPGAAGAAAPTVVPPLPPAAQWAVTTNPAALHSQPSDDSDQFAVLPPLAPVGILGYQGDWATVWNPRTGGTAFVRSDLLGPGDAPSPYLLKERPPLQEQLDEPGIVTQRSTLAVYPTTADDAADRSVSSSAWVTVSGVVQGDDGSPWYGTTDGDYLPTGAVFLPNHPDRYVGHWLDVDLASPARVTGYQGAEAVRSFLTIKGAGPRPTPTGTFTILRRVADETMNSDTIGIPRNGPGGYYLTGVLFTQYFTDDGASLHYNYWSSMWGYAGSHGCLGLTYNDSAWLWSWADVGTPVSIHY